MPALAHASSFSPLEALRRGARKIVSARTAVRSGAVRTADAYTLSSGMLNNTIFISKIFSQKIWPKNWGGSSNGGFRERHVCGPVLLHPAPFRADEKYPREVLPEGRISS